MSEIKNYLIKYLQEKDWGTSDADIQELLEESPRLYDEMIDSRRWWDDYFYVVDIGGKKIGFYGARTTGDASPKDVGWEFNMNDIFEVEEREEVIVKKYYVKKGDLV